MKLLAIFKDNKLQYGNPEQISRVLGMTAEAVRRWVRDGVKVTSKRDYIVFVDTEKLNIDNPVKKKQEPAMNKPLMP